MPIPALTVPTTPDFVNNPPESSQIASNSLAAQPMPIVLQGAAIPAHALTQESSMDNLQTNDQDGVQSSQNASQSATSLARQAGTHTHENSSTVALRDITNNSVRDEHTQDGSTAEWVQHQNSLLGDHFSVASIGEQENASENHISLNVIFSTTSFLMQN